MERRFHPHSYANRRGKGTHRAIDQLQQYARRYRYVLRLDIVKHFPSLDHAILKAQLATVTPEKPIMDLIAKILSSGAGVLDDEYEIWNSGALERWNGGTTSGSKIRLTHFNDASNVTGTFKMSVT